jgi:hypothetical protein
MNSRDLHQQSLDALLYHTAQTRPIPSTNLVIEKLRAFLAAPEPVKTETHCPHGRHVFLACKLCAAERKP